MPPAGRAAVGVPLVGALAAAWATWGGSATADAARATFRVLDPVLVLELTAALAVVGVGLAVLGRRAPRPAAPGRIRALAARVPTAVALAVVVAVVATFRVALGAAYQGPTVLGDELIYAGLAKGWALHGEPLLRGTVEVGYSTVYPLFLAPAFALAADGAGALAAVKALNATAMALTAVPAFALARRVLPRGWALGVAALAVLVPWTAYSALTLTESLFYPVFVAYAAVLGRALERPTLARQGAMLATLVLLVGVRSQGLVVALGTVLAILVDATAVEERRAALRRFLPTFALLAALAAAGLVARAAGVALPTGTYDPLYDSLSRLGGMLEWGAWSVASFGLVLGVVALAAFPVAVRGMLRARAPAVRATGSVALALSLALLGSVALLAASPFGLGRLHERSLFYAAPLLLIPFAHWLRGGLERPRALAAVSAVAVVALAAALPEEVVFESTTHDLPSSAFFLALDAQVPGVPFTAWAIALAAAGAATFLLARGALFPIATVVLAFAAVTARVDYTDPMTGAQAQALAWVDRALPDGAGATLVHLGLPYGLEPCASAAHREQHELVVWTEYFNAQVDEVRYLYEPNQFDHLASRELTVGSGGLLLDGERPFAPVHVVIDSRQRVTGTPLRRFDLAAVGGPWQAGGSLTLWRVDPPLRIYDRPEPFPPRADGHGC